MDVILREDVEKLGTRGQLVKVTPGYARNFLLPKRLAVAATESNKKIVEQERQAHLRREAKEVSDASDLGKMMADVSITISQKAGENDQLFGSVTSKDIAEALEKQGYTIERRKIVPRRISGVCTPHQRRLAEAIKQARNIALIPFAAPI